MSRCKKRDNCPKPPRAFVAFVVVYDLAVVAAIVWLLGTGSSRKSSVWT